MTVTGVDLYTFYVADGGPQVDRRWTTATRALEHGAALSDEMGCAIEIARGPELDFVAIYDPEE